jgi:hypothetical protein
MRNSSLNLLTPYSKNVKRIRGGERKVMKKSLSILLAISLVFSMFASVALADKHAMTTTEKFEALKGKGVFSGFEDGTAGLNQPMTRAQAAVIISKLFGLNESNAPSTAKFSDVPVSHWAHPYVEAASKAGIISGLGDGRYNPNGNVTAQELAVMAARGVSSQHGLEIDMKATASGNLAAWAQPYVAAAVGWGFLPAGIDYTTQALRSLLVEATYAANTVVESLKAIAAIKIVSTTVINANTIHVVFSDNVAPVPYTLATPLVANTATEIMITHAPSGAEFKVTVTLVVNVKIASATGVSNALVEVKLSEDITSVSAAEFSITNAAGAALAVTNADRIDSKTVHLTTATQTAGALYTVSASNTNANFVGQVAVTGNPTLTSAVATANNKVKLTFSRDMTASVKNIANYSIAGLSILTADYNGTNKAEVILTTAAQTQGTIYTAIVTNVTDFSLNAISTSDNNNQKQFGGLAADTTKPTLNSVAALSNTTVQVTFSKDVDATTSQNIANYTIAGLGVLKAEIDKDDKKIVVLTTNAQTQGTIYTAVVNNVTDTSGNVVDTANNINQKQFGGLAADTTKPVLDSVVAKSNTTVELDFSKNIATASGENIANYSIAGLTISKAAVKNDKVTLTTSAQTQGTIYTVKVTGVTDAAGNVIDTAASASEKQFGGLAADTSQPKLNTATATNNTTVQVVFDKDMNESEALKPFNYNLGTELGYALKVTKVDSKTFNLTTQKQESKVYEVVVTGVTDTSGNAINTSSNNNKKSFGGNATAAVDTTAPTVTSAVATAKNTLRITFSEAIDSIAGGNVAITVNSGTDTNNFASAGKSAVVLTDSSTVAHVLFDDNMTQGVVYKVTVTGVQDKAANNINVDKNTATFAGITANNPAPEVTSAVLINNQTLQLTFSEPVEIPVALVAGDLTYSAVDGYSAYAGVFSATGASLSSNKTTLTVYYNDTAKFVSGNLYKVSLEATKIFDVFGATGNVTLSTTKNSATFAGISTAAAAPRVSTATAINVNTLDITFNQAVNVTTANLQGGAGITVATLANVAVVVDAEYVRTEGSDKNKIRVFFDGTPFTAGEVYKLTIADASNVVNLNGANLHADHKTANFAAISTANPAPKLLTATATSNTKVTVKLSEKVLNVTAGAFTVNGGATVTAVDVADTARVDTVVLTVTGLTGGTVYEVTVDNSITDEAGVANIDTATKVQFVAMN